MRKKITGEDILKQLEKHYKVLEKYHVKKIGLFGSYARGEQTKTSDIDFLVEFEKPDFDNFMDLVFFLEDLFGSKVELITNEGISPYIKPYVEKEVKWYEKGLAVS